ncbi:unnamed protein product [Brassica oleracea var. botrytis]|nr:unnamed protein product [Brassica napus]CDY38064.1 BnaC03g75030D [Brassica napus]VDC96364.1 unnamed protein product [Brassica oleracea]
MMTKDLEKAATINVSALTCIDLASPDLHRSAVLLKQACLECGFFYVINHGLCEELKDDAFEQEILCSSFGIEDESLEE